MEHDEYYFLDDGPDYCDVCDHDTDDCECECCHDINGDLLPIE